MELLELETDRLTLRAPGIADVDHITRICQDGEISRFTTVPYPYRREDAAEFVHDVIPAGWASGLDLSWGIYPKPESHLAGVVSLSGIRDGVAELGYWIDPHLRGRGLMTEAVARVVEFALSGTPEGLGLRRIGWEAVSGNSASARVAMKAGFRWEGRRRGAALRHGIPYDLDFAGLLHTDDRDEPQTWP